MVVACRAPLSMGFSRQEHWSGFPFPSPIDGRVVNGFPGGSVGKECACNAGDLCSIHVLGTSLEEDMASPSGIPAWEVPWTEGSGGLQSMGSVSTAALASQADSLLLSHQGTQFLLKNCQILICPFGHQ